MAKDRQDDIESLVAYLCSPECAGRAPGTPESAAARARIVHEFERAGLEPAGTDGYLQAVPGCGANVLGRVPGSGALSDRAVLVAAHYDHLGRDRSGGVYWGADDNAAGVAILVDVARTLASRRSELDRQIIVASFDGEEPPHFLQETMGSLYYATHPTFPIDSIDMMVCMDLVGHALGPESFPDPVRQTLFVMGAELSHGTGEMVDRAAGRATGVRPRRLHLDVVPPLSDYYAFRQVGVPVLFLTCGRGAHYHRTTDTPDQLDFPKVVATADFLADLLIDLANRPETLVDIDEGNSDDLASVTTLLELSRDLAPLIPEARSTLAELEALHAMAGDGPLPADRRQLLSAVVLYLEQMLS